jgi:protein tyrosine/serine phosphatase
MSGVKKRQIRILAIGLAVAAGGGGGLIWWQSTLMPKRFGTVAEGKLYRSGEVTPAHLERLKNEYGIRRVVSLLNPSAPESVAEREAAERLGLEWHNIPLPGNGDSTRIDRQRILALLTEPNAPPTLVHCSAGANRTGLAVGLYRIHAEGWSYDAALDELRRYDFEDLPKHEDLRRALKQAADGEVDAEPHSTERPPRDQANPAPRRPGT